MEGAFLYALSEMDGCTIPKLRFTLRFSTLII